MNFILVDKEQFKCPNCDTKYNSETEMTNCDSQISPECFNECLRDSVQEELV